jgi:hypothetical protein
MKVNLMRFGIVMIASLFLWGCYPDGAYYYEDTDITFTQYDVDFDFNTRSTFALPDKIVIDVEIEDGDTTYVFMKDAFALPILSNIRSNMENYGWNEVDISNNPDVVLSPAAMKNTTVYYSYWYDWWYGGFYPGWGWYYPPYYSISSYTTGTMIIAIADPNVSNPVDRSEVSWLMVGNGLASGSGNVNRVTDAIDQAFKQSPYLKIN